jgi:FG-GAP-like repeat/FG-GAP repeat
MRCVSLIPWVLLMAGVGCLNSTTQLDPVIDSGVKLDAGPLTDSGVALDAGPLDFCVDGGFVSGLESFVVYRAGNAYQSRASADLNGDGILDLVAVYDPWWYNGFDVLLGQPDGGLSPPAYYSIGDGFAKPVIRDLNGDGVPDITMSNGSSALVYFQLDDGGFADPVVYPAASNVSDIGLADLNGDGMPDLILAEYETPDAPAGAEIRINQGAGVFGPPEPLPGAGVGIWGGMAVGDFDRDGLADIAVTALDGGMIVFLNNVDGGFSLQRTPVAPWGEMIALAQPDGTTTFALTGLSGVQLVSLSAGQLVVGALLPVPASEGLPTEEVWIGTGDFNDDGVADIVVSTHYACDQEQGGVAVFYGLNDGGFAAAVAVSTIDSYLTDGVAPLGPVDHPRALAIAGGCGGAITVAGDASRHCAR